MIGSPERPLRWITHAESESDGPQGWGNYGWDQQAQRWVRNYDPPLDN